MPKAIVLEETTKHDMLKQSSPLSHMTEATAQTTHIAAGGRDHSNRVLSQLKSQTDSGI